jgi:Rieske Fe-S protein
VVALLGGIIYPIIRFIIPPQQPEAATSQVVAAKVGELEPNSGKIFRFGKDPAILIRTPTGEYRAFTAICTHLDCTVQFRPDLEQIWCACHNGHYDLYGNNVSGPPPAPLKPYKVAVRGDQIVVSKA